MNIDLSKIIYDEKSYQLTWSVHFLYPEFNDSDYITNFHELDSFQDHIDVVFQTPAPWDKNRHYSPNTLSLYF